MKKILLLIFITLAATGCENNDNSFLNLTNDDREIVEMAYSTTYRYPPGFNVEQNLDGSLYYENTISIGTSQTSWIELNTNDKYQAKKWSETSSNRSSYYRDLVAERETEKYFEFKRVYSEDTDDVILSRVHKSSYFIPAFDKFHPGNTIGTLKVSPINKETAKDFIEYLWTSYVIGYDDKVLEYTATEYSEKVQYNLKSVSVIYGDFGLCDTIQVMNFDFVVDKRSGIVTFEARTIKEIKGTCR